jgi:aryl-alcohol dehydrogenase-like predicted oxidoreductase
MNYPSKKSEIDFSSKLSKISLGSAQFGSSYGISNVSGPIDQKVTCDILQLAFDVGILHIDTARSYPNSETFLGRCGVSRFNIVTKMPTIPNTIKDVKKWILTEFNRSLSNLRVDKICGLLLHDSRSLLSTNGEEIIKSLEELRVNGLVDKIGVSVYTPQELSEVYNRFKVDLIQLPLNIFDRRFEESGWLNTLKKDGVEIHARSIFLQGLLLLPRNRIPAKFEIWAHNWSNYHSYLRKSGYSALELCLNYPLNLLNIDKVVLGVDSPQHLREIVTCAKNDMVTINSEQLSTNEKLLIDPSCWDKL